jgi:hypothetical protein
MADSIPGRRRTLEAATTGAEHLGAANVRGADYYH